MAVTLVVGTESANVLNGSAGADLIYGFPLDGPQNQVASITATRVAAGLTQPLFVTAPEDDAQRLFIVEKTGRIKVLDLSSGQVLATPFLDVSSQISTVGEQGLLGLAFHPNFATNGLFYVQLTNPSGDNEIRRYQVFPNNPNQANPATATPVITIDLPSNASNHRAGWLGFGPDGFLYAAVGDGGSTPNSAQNIDDLAGNILRLDIN
ncbi:MAG TPA: PQQ-dependent sugar dehydrogenase, partial [Xanthobacteraceae bacterium]|nr:PQQ-dependent sugar dehydrogenase [Xanthobacteraceae bacterium]